MLDYGFRHCRVVGPKQLGRALAIGYRLSAIPDEPKASSDYGFRFSRRFRG
jgi:hypothetical protein